jgi:hypothetical protein
MQGNQGAEQARAAIGGDVDGEPGKGVDVAQGFVGLALDAWTALSTTSFGRQALLIPEMSI